MKFIAVVALLAIATPAAAREFGKLRVDNTLSLYATDDTSYRTRVDNVFFLKHRDCRLWVQDLFLWDHPSQRNNRLTIGLHLGLGFSIVGQRQDITGRIPVHRVGVQFKL